MTIKEFTDLIDFESGGQKIRIVDGVDDDGQASAVFCKPCRALTAIEDMEIDSFSAEGSNLFEIWLKE